MVTIWNTLDGVLDLLDKSTISAKDVSIIVVTDLSIRRLWELLHLTSHTEP